MEYYDFYVKWGGVLSVFIIGNNNVKITFNATLLRYFVILTFNRGQNI